jgi:hypothetical protein
VRERPSPVLDPRDAPRLLGELLARRAGYVPEWLGAEKSAGWALLAVAARYLQAVAQRLNQTPDKHQLAFLDLLGVGLIAAQPARVPVVFRLAAQAQGGSAPARTPVAAPPPPGSNQQVVFETERALGVTGGRLVQVVSLWPGRDESIDHTAAFLAGQPVQPFARTLRRPTPHHLYLSHPTLLALAGNVELAVEFELAQGASAPLEMLWEYWDGEVWRGFGVSPCDRTTGERDPDSTDGLTGSGRFLLHADGVQASQTEVAGAKGYWLRARLTQALPADAERLLPEVDRVRLSSTVDRSLRGTLQVAEPQALPALVASAATTPILALSSWPTGGAPVPFALASLPAGLSGRVLNQAGQPVAGATVVLVRSGAAAGETSAPPTNEQGEYAFPGAMFGEPYAFRVVLGGVEFAGPGGAVAPRQEPTAARPRVDLTLVVDGLRPDKAFADGAPLDVSKPFYPCGQQPQPGSTFYFTSEEAFSKPGAKLRLYLARTRSPQDEAAVTTATFEGVTRSTPLDHLLRWEYWNGRAWAALAPSSNVVASRLDLDRTEMVDLEVPPDMAPLELNGEEARWMRVRLQSGAFGFRQEVTFQAGSGAAGNTFTFVVAQPPVLADFRLGYTWQYGPFHPERVTTFNDFRYQDHTYAATWPGVTFLPFERVADVTPALYLGLDRKPPVDQLGFFFDVAEDPEVAGPALTWEFWDGSAWRSLSAEDETGHLRRPGLVSLLAAPEDAPLARFGTPLHFVRARLKEDGPPGEPVVTGIFPNAVWASEWRTLRDVPIGASRGTPGQVFTVTTTPVLAGEKLEVRELAGARANVEWRLLARELFGGEAAPLRALEEQLAREGLDTDVPLGPLRLRRNRRKEVTEAWVRWTPRPQLHFSGPAERHYALDRALGRLAFGDGINGRIPPAGAAVLMREMASGGGAAGNVGPRTVTQLLGVVPGIEAVFNPRAAEGGADGEAPGAVLQRGPRTVRHRGRAVAPADFEALAREASAAVAVARAIPNRHPSGRPLPGWLALLIVPRSQDPRPYPSFGLREHVRRFVGARAAAELAGLERLYVIGPRYLPVDVKATLVARAGADAGAVERSARSALESFLHPLHGGPGGEGFELGRDVFLSDVAATLERVQGVDYVEELALLEDGVPQGERVAVPDDVLVAAGAVALKLERVGR